MSQLKFLLPLLSLAVGLAVHSAYAHGFGERYDLPLPLGYFAIGGAAAVALSFVLVGTVVRGESREFGYPRFNLWQFPWLRAALGDVTLFPVRLVSFLLLALIVAAGLLGDQRPVENLAPTFVWVIWWVGMGFLVALLGNLWEVINPWKVFYTWIEALYHRFWPEQKCTLGYEYPQNWGIWPAVILFFAFSWVENAFGEGATGPSSLALLVIAYSVITLAGMFIFGKRQWLRHGEPFSVVFGYFSRFSITEVRAIDAEACRECGNDRCRASGDQRARSERAAAGNPTAYPPTYGQGGGPATAGDCIDCYECFEFAQRREFNLRPPAVGLMHTGRVSTDVVVMVIFLLASVTFDGFSATPEWSRVQGFFITQFPQLDSPLLNGLTIANTLGLVGFPLVFAAIYWGFTGLMRRATGRETPSGADPDACFPTEQALVAAFVFTLLPIALAYNYAHFLGFLLIQGQLIIPLASDPFGWDWDLFGTGDYLVNIQVVGAQFVWFFSVAVIVLGHIVAVYLAHLRARELYHDQSAAMKSQIPMLALMVIYTVVSLWIISRPITE